MSNPITHIDLKEIGYPEGYLIGIALKINKKRTGYNRENISLINKNVEAEVKKIKEQKGKDMIIFASSKLVQSFTNVGLIDEYRIVVHPVLLGSGKRLFDGIAARKDLNLESTKTYPNGAVLLRYVASSQ